MTLGQIVPNATLFENSQRKDHGARLLKDKIAVTRVQIELNPPGDRLTGTESVTLYVKNSVTRYKVDTRNPVFSTSACPCQTAFAAINKGFIEFLMSANRNFFTEWLSGACDIKRKSIGTRKWISQSLNLLANNKQGPQLEPCGASSHHARSNLIASTLNTSIVTFMGGDNNFLKIQTFAHANSRYSETYVYNNTDDACDLFLWGVF